MNPSEAVELVLRLLSHYARNSRLPPTSFGIRSNWKQSSDKNLRFYHQGDAAEKRLTPLGLCSKQIQSILLMSSMSADWIDFEVPIKLEANVT